MERIIPRKSHSTKAICSFIMLNKGRSKINHMTNAVYFYDGKRVRNTNGNEEWMDMRNEATVWKILIVSVVIYLYSLNPPSSSYNAINTL